MNMKAEEVADTTNYASEGDQADAIADILVGKEDDKTGEEAKKEPEVKPEEAAAEDLEGVEKPSEESTEEAASKEGAEGEEEVTWENVLGVEEGQLNFDEDGNLAGVNTKVDGQTTTVKMADLIAGFQNNKSFTQKSQAFAEERKNWDDQRGHVEQQLTAKLQDVTLMSNYLEKQLVSEFEGINWEQLRVDNPAEYAALRQDFSSRATELQQLKEAAKQTEDANTAEATEKAEAVNKQRLSDEYNKMLGNNPTWQNPETYKAEMGKLKDFCTNQYGFSDDDFKFVTDARLIELIKDANAYRKGIKVAGEKLKKPVPQFQKSAGQPSNKVTKLQRLTKAAQKATGENKRNLQSEAIAEIITGGQT